MTTTLICLLSDQHVPNLLSALHYQPARLIAIVSPDMEKKGALRSFKAALELSLNGTINVEEVSIRSAVSFHQLQEDYEKLLQRVNDDLIVNITGGTKPMSLQAYSIFQNRARSVVYIDGASPEVLYDLKTTRLIHSPQRITMKAFLAGYGFDLTTQQDNFMQWARKYANLAAMIAQKQPEGSLVTMIPPRWMEAERRGIELGRGELHIQDNTLREHIAQAFFLNVDDGSLVGRLHPRAFRFLAGRWLEIFLWKALDDCRQKLGLWDVCLGGLVTDHTTGASNDLDVCFMRNHALHVVECKTGRQSDDPKAEALYKLEAITQQFRALRVQSYLASSGGNLYGRDGCMKRSVMQRAGTFGCRVLNREDIRLLAGANGQERCAGLRDALGFA